MTTINIERLKQQTSSLLSSVRSLLTGVGAICLILFVALLIMAGPGDRPGNHNQQWFYNQVCLQSNARWKAAIHSKPLPIEEFFDGCAAEVKGRK